MSTVNQASRAELIDEIRILRQQLANCKLFQKQIEALVEANQDLKSQYNQLKKRTPHLTNEKDQRLDTLQIAQVIIEHSPAILFRRFSDDPKLLYVSDNISQIGYTADEFLNQTIQFKDIVHPEDRERISHEIDHYAQQNAQKFTMHYRIVTKDGETRWVEDRTAVVRDEFDQRLYNQGIVIDITERKAAQDKLRKSEEKFRRIIETTGEGFLFMDDNLRITEANEAYCRMLGYDAHEILGKTSFDLAATEFKNFLSLNKDAFLAREYRKLEGAFIAKDGRTVPVLIHGNTLRDEMGHKIGNICFVSDLTEQKKSLALAGKVQRSLIPQSGPRIKGLDVAGRSYACEEVGGDYFDYLSTSDHMEAILNVVVGDISGHGVDAALLMTSARAYIRMRASQSGGPAKVVSMMNRDLAPDMMNTSHFMTLFFIAIDPLRRSVQWVRAGHEPALIYNLANDDFDELAGQGIPLGVDPDYEYQNHICPQLPPGTLIIIGTDGLWEANNTKGQAFGKERFRQAIRHHAGEPAHGIIEKVFAELFAYTKGVPLDDDLTLVIIKIEPER